MTKEVATIQTTEITPAALISQAVQSGASIKQLKELMDLQERYEANEAKKAYVLAMSRFRANCPVIEKTKNAHNSMYSGLAESIDAIKSLLSKNKLSHSWKTNQEGAIISVSCCVTHSQGHSECTTLSGPADQTGSKNAIQAIGSTVSYLQRYTLFSILGLASMGQDDDGGSPTQNPKADSKAPQKRSGGSGKATDKQIHLLQTKLVQASLREIDMLAYFQITDISQMQFSGVNDALGWIDKGGEDNG